MKRKGAFYFKDLKEWKFRSIKSMAIHENYFFLHKETKNIYQKK